VTLLIKEPIETIEATVGFSEETVRQASAIKNEPEWMLEFRLNAWRTFESLDGFDGFFDKQSHVR